MRTIGIRVAPTVVTFAVYDCDEQEIINAEDIKIPAAFPIPEALKYIRNTILDILREYGVEKAGIRVTESTSRNLSIPRIQIEGVIQEAFASSSLSSYYIGQISSISAKVGIPKVDFKKYISGELDFSQVEHWNDLTNNQKESVFCAIGAANA